MILTAYHINLINSNPTTVELAGKLLRDCQEQNKEAMDTMKEAIGDVHGFTTDEFITVARFLTLKKRVYDKF